MAIVKDMAYYQGRPMVDGELIFVDGEDLSAAGTSAKMLRIGTGKANGTFNACGNQTAVGMVFTLSGATDDAGADKTVLATITPAAAGPFEISAPFSNQIGNMDTPFAYLICDYAIGTGGAATGVTVYVSEGPQSGAARQ